MKYWNFQVVRDPLFEDSLSFLLLETLKSVFLPLYASLKLNHDTNSSMTSEDTVEDPLMSVKFHLKSKVFWFVLQSIYCI